MDTWPETLRERGCDQRGPRGFAELPRCREIADGVCGKDGEGRCWQLGRIRTREMADAGGRG